MTLHKGEDDVKKKLRTLLSIGMMVLMLPLSVSAVSTDETGSLTIQFPSGGAGFTFYKVAEISNHREFDVVAPFALYMNEIEGLDSLEKDADNITADTWRNLAVALDTYVTTGKLNGQFEKTVNEDGKAVIEGIEKGLYLILGEQVEMDGVIYTTSPVLVTIPNRDIDGAWQNQVTVDYSGKLSAENIDEYKAVKIWDDEKYENNRPEEIEVTLYKDGEKYEEAVLNEDNNWEHTWTNLPQGAKWTVKEDEVPAGYKVTYIREDDATVIENVFIPAPKDTPSGGKIGQTGQLWWPVPILAILGIAFFAIGWSRRNSGER